MFKAKSEEGKAIFYTFEVLAAIVAVVFVIVGILSYSSTMDIYASIYDNASTLALGTMFEYFAQAIAYCAIIFGIGKMIDLKCAKCCKKDKEEE